MQRNNPHVWMIRKSPLQPPPLILQPHQLILRPSPHPMQLPPRIRRLSRSPMVVSKLHGSPQERRNNNTIFGVFFLFSDLCPSLPHLWPDYLSRFIFPATFT